MPASGAPYIRIFGNPSKKIGSHVIVRTSVLKLTTDQGRFKIDRGFKPGLLV